MEGSQGSFCHNWVVFTALVLLVVWATYWLVHHSSTMHHGGQCTMHHGDQYTSAPWWLVHHGGQCTMVASAPYTTHQSTG